LARRDRKGSLNDGRIQHPSNPFGMVPLSNFAPRGFAFFHHSIAIFYHEVPNPISRSQLFDRSMSPGLLLGGGGAPLGTSELGLLGGSVSQAKPALSHSKADEREV
jgi:hypothetical protein